MVCGGWTSEQVARGYYEDSDRTAGEHAARILGSDEPPTAENPVTVTVTFQPHRGQQVQTALP